MKTMRRSDMEQHSKWWRDNISEAANGKTKKCCPPDSFLYLSINTVYKEGHKHELDHHLTWQTIPFQILIIRLLFQLCFIENKLTLGGQMHPSVT